MKTCEAIHGTFDDNGKARGAVCGRRAVVLRKYHDADEAFLCDRCNLIPEMERGGYTDHSVDPPHHHRIPTFTEDALDALDRVIATTPEPHLAMFSAEWIRAMSRTIHEAWEDRDRALILARTDHHAAAVLRHEGMVLRRELAGTDSNFGRPGFPVPAACECTPTEGQPPPSHASGNLVICELCAGVRL